MTENLSDQSSEVAHLREPVEDEKDETRSAEKDDGSGDATISKNQMKKRSRHEAYLKMREERTELRRQKKKEIQRLKRESKEECSEIKLEKVQDEVTYERIRCPRSTSRREAFDPLLHCFYLSEFLDKCSSQPTIVIDCMFEGLQTEKELSSLSQQLMFSYGINRKSDHPFRLILCGLYPALIECLERISGYENWACQKYTSPCLEVFGLSPVSDTTLSEHHEITPSPSPGIQESQVPMKQRLIYLSADSEHVLDSLDSCAVYVIGGLVDRNRYPGLTEKRAREWGIQTARLPIQTHYKLGGSKVLTVNQVFDILSKWIELRDWKTAIRAAIPSRKLLIPKEIDSTEPVNPENRECPNPGN